MNALYSVSTPALKQYLSAADSLSVDTQTILSRHGVSAQVLADNDARVPLAQFEAIITALVDASGHPYFGLYASNHINPSMYASLGLISISAASLRACIELVPTYETLVGDMGYTELTDQPQWMSLNWHCRLNNTVARRHVSEAVLASWFLYGKKMLGLEGELSGLSFQHDALGASRKEYQAVFGCEPIFKQEHNALFLPKADMDKPLPQANAVLQDSLIVHANHLLDQLHPKPQGKGLSDIHQQMNSLLKDKTLSKSQLAQALNVSPRTLQRRFEQSGTSYQNELSLIRLTLAKKLLLENTDSQSICVQLGFSEPRSFFRRFKQWTGMTTGEYVKQQRASN